MAYNIVCTAEETPMPRKQRNLLFAVAAFTLVIGLQSLATAQTQMQSDAQKQRMERWCIQQRYSQLRLQPRQSQQDNQKGC
jgi:Tfp pilus assembly protein PilV